MTTKKTKVLVTGTGGRSIGSGILQSLISSTYVKNNSWEIIAADADPFAWGLYKTQKSFILPLVNKPNYLSALKNIVNKNNITAIIPGTEAETELLSANIEYLMPTTIICNKKELMPLMTDKNNLQKKLSELNLKFIASYYLKDYDKYLKTCDFPLIVKPVIGTGGSKNVHLVENLNELKVLVDSLKPQENFCIQPYIGSDETEYTVGVLSDKGSAIIDSIVLKRKLIGLSLLNSKKIKGTTFSISTGYSQGYIVDEPEIQQYCESLALKLDSRGPLNIQLRIHNKVPYIFEIHPRFSGTTPIRADVGFNETEILLRNYLNNEPFGRLNYQRNVAAIRSFQHVIVPIEEMKVPLPNL